jgi:hypothetical protein
MNKQKIKVGYVLSDEAVKKYFLEGKKVEKNQEIEIETDNEEIIKLSVLINNEYLEIPYSSIEEKRNCILDIRKYESYFETEKDYFESKEKEKYTYVNIDWNEKFFPAEKILTSNEMLEILEYEKSNEYQELEKKKIEYQKIFDENLKRIESEEEKKEKEKEKEKEAKEKLIQEEKIMIDDFVENQGSETLKLRKELGYDYKGLALQEACDLIELKGYEKIEDNNDVKEIFYLKKPNLEYLKIEKDIKKRDNVDSVFLKCWSFKTDNYYDSEDYKEIVLNVHYKIFNSIVERNYILK